MKKLLKVCVLLFVAVVVASCDKLMGTSTAYEVDAIAFQEESGGKWGLMDLSGNVVVKPKFELQPTASVNGRFFVPDYDAGKFTLYTTELKPKKLGDFRDVGMFMGDLCPVVDKNGKAKYIDKDGKKVFDLKKISGKEVTNLYNFTDGRALVKLENDKYGFIDDKGSCVIPCKYQDAWCFAEGVAWVVMTEDSNGNGKWGIIDKDGEVLFTKKTKELRAYNNYYRDGLLVCVDKNDRFVLIDKKGEVKLKMKKDQSVSSEIVDGKFVFYDSNSEKYGMMDVNGETLIRAKYSSMYYNGKVLAATTDGDKWNLFTTSGDKLERLPDSGYPILFDREFKGYDGHFLMGSWSDGYVLVDKDGNEVDLDIDIYDYSNSVYYSASISFNAPGDSYDYYDDYGDDDDYDIDWD